MGRGKDEKLRMVMQIAETNKKGTVFSEDFTGWQEILTPLLDRSGLAHGLADEPLIIIKPNLVEVLPPPITTPPALVVEIVAYIRRYAPDSRLLVAEGCGSLQYDTSHCFAELGYHRLVRDHGVELVDFNQEQWIHRKNPACLRWPEMYLPEIAFDAFLISVPVLKAHSLAGVTLTMKNMMGLAPPAHYQRGGHWKKASFHAAIHEAIFDLNRYRSPDFTILDATVGMAEFHLGGPTCTPPVNTLAASWDPVAIDAYGTGLLGQNWRDIGHIRLADGVLGQADYIVNP